jgi:hypothetical protein
MLVPAHFLTFKMEKVRSEVGKSNPFRRFGYTFEWLFDFSDWIFPDGIRFSNHPLFIKFQKFRGIKIVRDLFIYPAEFSSARV